MLNEYEGSDKNESTLKNRWVKVVDLMSMLCLATFFLYFALKYMWDIWKVWRRARNLELRTQWRQRLLSSNSISTNTTTTTNNNNGGLEIGVIQALPMFRYSLSMKASDGESTECAICLCEFVTNESGRVLPRCKHRFHTECIDMWISSHSNCPLCRSSVLPFPLPNGPASLQMVPL